MNTGTHAALTALNQAIELEVKGQRFYLEAAERTTNPKGAEMFRSLADDEAIHERILRRQLEALGKGKGWMPAFHWEGSEAIPEVQLLSTMEIASSLCSSQ